MLITAILSSLGLSVLADEQDDEKEEYYTIFEWNDGMKMGRVLRHFRDCERVFCCGGHVFHINTANYLDTRSIEYTMIKHKALICQRLAWLAFTYLDCRFGVAFGYKGVGWNLLPVIIPNGFVEFAEKGAPDKADPYEMTIYESGQMNKSLFFLSRNDFLKTIGGLK